MRGIVFFQVGTGDPNQIESKRSARILLRGLLLAYNSKTTENRRSNLPTMKFFNCLRRQNLSHLRFVRLLFLYLVMVPRTFFSPRFREQLARKKLYFPHVKTKIRLIRTRNWGQDFSVTISPRIRVLIDDVLPNDHPEIVAFLAGEPAIEKLLKEQAELGVSAEYLNRRRELTPKLLSADLSELFSEAVIDQSGRIRIHDGHHRAGVARALGDGYHNIIFSTKVNFT